MTKETFIGGIFDCQKSQTWNYLGELPAIVDFYSDTCPPCKVLAPILEELSEEYRGKVSPTFGWRPPQTGVGQGHPGCSGGEVRSLMSIDLMPQIQAAIAVAQRGERAAALMEFERLFPLLGDDPLANCVFAHYMADLQAKAEAELYWDRRSLEYLDRLSDARLKDFLPSLDKAGFYASILLNVAESCRKLGKISEARDYAIRAAKSTRDLTDDGYAKMVRAGIQRLADRLGLSVTIAADPPMEDEC